ncbi:MAG: type II toxin-antitoxin system RelE/ParE family toxin [Pseudomonadota bacterium]
MASYKIEWKRSAEKDLRKIDRLRIPLIMEAVEALTKDPFPPGCRKLHGTEHQYRVRVGDNRVIYEVDGERNGVVIYHIRHRKDAYRK